MASNIKLETIYVDLDALMDTRLGTIHQYDSSLAAKVVSSGTYHNRDIDEFVFADGTGLDKDTFKELYSKRDKSVLTCSTITNVMHLLKSLVNTFREQAIVRPYHDGCRIYINLYPYVLSDDEISIMRSAIDVWLKQFVPIDFINLNPVMLSPSYCKQTFAIMIKYEYEEWLNVNASAFENCRLPEVSLYAPAIYFNKKPTEEELAESIKKAKHPMIAIESLVSPLICLRLFDAELFSIINLK